MSNKQPKCGFSKKGMKQVAQRGGGCSIPVDTQGQAGWGSEHLMELWVSLFIEGELDQKLEGSLPNLTGL